MHTSTVTIKGQVTIPLDYRKQLSLNPGDQVFFVREPNGILLKRSFQEITSAFGIIKSKCHASIDDMEKTIRKRASECLQK